MKIRITFIFMLICLVVSAQEYKYIPFPDSNAVWNESRWGNDTPEEFVQYALFNEDTIINGIVYHKIYYNVNLPEITIENSRIAGGIREDEHKRVWAINLKSPYFNFRYLNENGEIMLYDFSLQVGDTIWAERNHANIGVGDYKIGVGYYLVVKQIDSLKIHQSIRKVFSFERYHWVKWIEGIGNIQGLFFPYGDLTTGGFNNKLICMHQNDTLMYIDTSEQNCIPQFVIDGIDILPNTEIKVYPNPATNRIVYFENLDFETLELFDSNGNLVRFENIKGTDCFELNVKNLSPGIYYFRLAIKGLAPTRGRLIMQ